MKIKHEFVIRKFGDKYIAVSANDSNDEPKLLIKLNRGSVFLLNLLENDIEYDNILKAIHKKYDMSDDKAKKELDAFLEKFRNAGLITE